MNRTKFLGARIMMVPSFLNGDHGDQWFYLIKSKKNWDTHLDNPTKARGDEGATNFQNYSPLTSSSTLKTFQRKVF